MLEILEELYERAEKAESELTNLAHTTVSISERDRLTAKVSGVKLIKGYIEDALHRAKGKQL